VKKEIGLLEHSKYFSKQTRSKTLTYMKSKKKPVIDETRKIRNISDYVYDCLNRLRDQADLILYLGKHKDDFAEDEPKRSLTIIISMVDVYSRDAIVILGTILDENRQTSSLYTMTDHIKDENKRKRYQKRLDNIKTSINQIVRARGNQVGHFNTKLNIHENGFIHINGIFQVDPRFIKKIANRIERFYWDIREELGVEGTFVFHKGEPIAKSFARLVGKGPKKL
jgi:hypothetical protein